MPHATSWTSLRSARTPLVPGGHLQTILGCYLPSASRSNPALLHHVPLPDGDPIALHDDGPHPSPSGRGPG